MAREWQDMKEESDTDSGSGSEWDPESSTDSDSLSENDRDNKGKKRKKTWNQSGSSKYSRHTLEHQTELDVTCGDKEGILNVEKYNDPSVQECIFSEGQWFTPGGFEKFGGRERSKKWKNSICCDGFPLQKLIETCNTFQQRLGQEQFRASNQDGLLSSFVKQSVQNEEIDSAESSPVADRLRRKMGTPTDSPESSPVANRLRKKSIHQQYFSSSESERGSSEGEDGDSDNSVLNVFDFDDDSIDVTLFEGPTLLVTCGSGSGVLHKSRFAKGNCGRCIRTQDFWLTPEDFIKLTKPGGVWRTDIISDGISLGKLVMKKVLKLHMINCDCEICEEIILDLNDDVCFMCNSEGDLVCCDDCPRAFHHHCHLPAVPKDLLSQWSCTFCVMKNMEESCQKSKRDVLDSSFSQYTQHCQCLLLHLLHDSMTDPCTNVPGYSENICGPKMLGRVKRKLENKEYQTVQEFVSDVKLVFHRCTSNSDNESSKMTSRLKEIFRREFKAVFGLQ